MPSSALQICRLQAQGPQLCDTLATDDRKLIKQLVERFSRACFYLPLPIKRVEGPRFAILQDSVQARQPVRAIAKNKVADDVECIPCCATFIAMGPRIGQSAQQGIECRRRTLKDGNRFVQPECRTVRHRATDARASPQDTISQWRTDPALLVRDGSSRVY